MASSALAASATMEVVLPGLAPILSRLLLLSAILSKGGTSLNAVEDRESLPINGLLGRGGANGKANVDVQTRPSIFSGSYHAFWLLPQVTRYVVSGCLGNVMFYMLDTFIFELINNYSASMPPIVLKMRETVSFSLAYFVQILPQHFLNAALCYGMSTINSRSKYMRTLMRTYSTLGFTLFMSMICNAIFTQWFDLPKDLSFAMTLFAGSISNYVLLTYFVANSSSSSSGETKSTRTLLPTSSKTGRMGHSYPRVPLRKTSWRKSS